MPFIYIVKCLNICIYLHYETLKCINLPYDYMLVGPYITINKYINKLNYNHLLLLFLSCTYLT